MSWKAPRRANLSTQAILHILEEEGVDPSLILEGTGLKRQEILDAETRISDTTEIVMTERAIALLPQKAGYGLRAGRSMRATTMGILGLTLLASPTIRTAFEIMNQFSNLSFLLSRASLKEEGPVTRIVVDMHSLPVSIHRFVFERYYAGSLIFLREMMPGLDHSIFTLHIPFSDPAYEDDLGRLTGCSVVSRQPEFALAADGKWFDQPLPQADPLAHAHFVGQCQAMLDQQQRLTNHAQLVRSYMIEHAQYAPCLDDVAANIGLSARSLRRRLREQETSFTHIVLETRMSLANEMLRTAGLPVSIVANKLGYAETASFTRAYRNWWGHNPSEAKRSN